MVKRGKVPEGREAETEEYSSGAKQIALQASVHRT